MKVVRKYLGLGVITVANLALQFIFQWYIIVHFGVGEISDAFFGAIALPQFLLLVMSGTLTKVLIPIIVKQEEQDFEKEAWTYFQVIGLLFIFIAVLLWLTAPWWVGVLLPGFSSAGSAMALSLTRIQLLAMALSAILGVLWAVQSAKERFYFIENTTLAANIASLLILWLAIPVIGIYAAAWASVLRILLQVILLMPVMGKYQRPDLRSKGFRHTWKQLRPLMAGNFYFKTDALLNRSLTSTGSTGELTLLDLAQQLYNMGSTIVGKMMVNTLIPTLSHKATLPDQGRALYNTFKRRLYLLLVVSLLFYLLLLFVGQPLLKVLFAFQHLDQSNVALLWLLMLLLLGFWVASLVGMLTTGTFYARGDTLTPTRIGVILFTLYIPVKIYTFKYFGVEGLAFSISIHMLLNVGLQVFFIHRASRQQFAAAEGHKILSAFNRIKS
jgi:putative peptidoglycan lipid II flippase